jgi:hypothetical protein
LAHYPTPRRGRGRPPLSDEFLTVVADAIASKKNGETDWYAVERALHRKVGESTVRSWKKQAQGRRLMPPAPARRQQAPEADPSQQRRASP